MPWELESAGPWGPRSVLGGGGGGGREREREKPKRENWGRKGHV